MNPLDQLKDIHLPGEVSQWPPAYGWWILALLLVALLVAGAFWLRNRVRLNKARKQALALLAQLEQNQSDWPQQLNILLKRLAASYFPTEQVASLHGHQWTEFLTKQVPQKKRTEIELALQELQQCLYRDQSEAPDFDKMTTQVARWIKLALPPKSANADTAEVNHV